MYDLEVSYGVEGGCCSGLPSFKSGKTTSIAILAIRNEFEMQPLSFVQSSCRMVHYGTE